eukprot:GHRR01005696.1.p1 GENE.GHRR01005696.1~~GHRR01005696.1.p1  ORF type:complete len:224 (+),score=66.59 GHRR01005696.1:491-1162(+)
MKGPTSPLAGKVLLVDDMRLNRLVLGRMLQKLGLEVIEAENGQVAIEQFVSHRHALSCVLLDLQMPVLDGWECAKRLRGLEQSSSWPKVPIVACTSLGLQRNWHDYDTVANSVLSCGVDDLLEKMPTMSELITVLGKYVQGLKLGGQQLETACSSSSPTAISITVSSSHHEHHDSSETVSCLANSVAGTDGDSACSSSSNMPGLENGTVLVATAAASSQCVDQ